MDGTCGGTGIGGAGLPLYSREQLVASPSARDGLEPHREAQWRRQYTHFIIDVGKSLEVPQWAIYTAVFLCQHYFVKRSMLRNDRYLVATACLFLACKVQESPKYLASVIKAAEVKKWGRWQREHPTEPRRWEDNAHLEAVREQLLVAERAVLYTVSFALSIKVPYPDLLTMQELLAGPSQQRHDIINIAWNLVNDSLHTTLCLQQPPEKIAAAALFLAHEVYGVPLPHRDGRGFCELLSVSPDELQDVCDQLLGVYTTVLESSSLPHTPGQGSEAAGNQLPSSPEPHEPRLQLQENRVRLARVPATELPPPPSQSATSSVAASAAGVTQPAQQPPLLDAAQLNAAVGS